MGQIIGYALLAIPVLILFVYGRALCELDQQNPPDPDMG